MRAQNNDKKVNMHLIAIYQFKHKILNRSRCIHCSKFWSYKKKKKSDMFFKKKLWHIIREKKLNDQERKLFISKKSICKSDSEFH